MKRFSLSLIAAALVLTVVACSESPTKPAAPAAIPSFSVGDTIPPRGDAGSTNDEGGVLPPPDSTCRNGQLGGGGRC
ncbi:hypothetical protein [Longimicrobium sp.]|jgi:hypothetical protein|uniref:hypothetical protein n=1 Tax=Longimicrobium sp. TaxID=2029185 RepID=UPI002F920A38